MTRRLPLLALVLIALAVGSLAGYALGVSKQAGGADARKESASAHARTQPTSERSAFAQGKRRGQRSGMAAGRRSGVRGAKARAERKVKHQVLASQPAPGALTAPAVPQRTPTADEMSLGTPGPEPVETICAPPFSYHMGICKIARPARPDECPDGWTPAGETGACAPPAGVDPEDPVEWPE